MNQLQPNYYSKLKSNNTNVDQKWDNERVRLGHARLQEEPWLLREILIKETAGLHIIHKIHKNHLLLQKRKYFISKVSQVFRDL